MSSELYTKFLETFFTKNKNENTPIGAELFSADHAAIDRVVGLKYLGGNEKGYLKVLEQFYNAYHDLNLESMEAKEFEMQMHSIKGLSATIGAMGLHYISKELYESKNKEFLPVFYNELEKVNKEIENIRELESIKFTTKTIDFHDFKEAKNSTKGYKPTVLIVDDVEANISILKNILHDYDLLLARDGLSALEIAASEYVELILLDIVMPKMDGYEVCIRLKENIKTSNIPVIFITSMTDAQEIDKAYDVGGIDYITKPFKPKELLARVKTNLSLYSVQRELEEKIKLIDKYVSYSSTDVDGVITEVSEAFCELLGFTKEELIGNKHNILRHPDVDSSVFASLWETIRSGHSWSGEIKNKKKNGEGIWENIIITPRYNEVGKLIGYTSIHNDITNEKRVEKLSKTDQLTDLHNRRYFNEIFPIEIKRAIRQGYALSFIMLDVDFFKQYNDTYGHQSGDEVLQKVAQTLKAQLKRSEDLVFRLGGEEFGVIYTANNCESIHLRAQEMCEAVHSLHIEHSKSSISPYLSISVGLACVDYREEKNYEIDSKKLYKLADDALYKAKESGRNTFKIISM